MNTLTNPNLVLWAARLIAAAWASWAFAWVVLSLKTKPVLRRERIATAISYRPPILLSLLLLVFGPGTHVGAALIAAGPATAWLYTRFIPVELGVVWLGAPLVVLGLGFAAWARLHLADNWSGPVTLRRDHELIRTGPYRFVRHPIYTGVLFAILGTACATGAPRGFLAFALVFAALWYKSRVEERLMAETFGDAYRSYRAEVRGLIPFVF